VNSPCASNSGLAPRLAVTIFQLTLVVALSCCIAAHADQLAMPGSQQPDQFTQPGSQHTEQLVEPVNQQVTPVKMVDLSHTSSGWAHFFDVFNPYAAFEYAYDSNILRLDDRTPAIGSRWDEYSIVDVGFASNIKEGQQQFIIDGLYSPHSYQKHPELNYQGGVFGSVWHWADTPALTGTLGYHFKRSLRDFANQLAPSRVKDIRNDQRYQASVDWNVRDNWIWGGRGEFGDINFDATPTLDLHKTTAGTSLTYISNAGNELGLDLLGYKGDYVNSTISYKEYDIGPTLIWKYTIRTQLKGNIAWSSRKYSGTGGPFRAERPSYSGPTANFELTIADAGRGSFVATVYQAISNLTDEVPDYAVVDGVSLEPGWTLSNNMTLQVRAGYEHRNFKESSGSIARQDDVGNLTGLFTWPIGRHWKFTASMTTEKRSSTRYLQAYEYLLNQLQITGIL
jgi:hypothetical protein